MTMAMALQPATWVIVLLVLAASWPLAQAFRHARQRPLAAYLLFVSVLVLVWASVFWLLIRAATFLLGPNALAGAGAALSITLLALLPGLAAGWWIVRRAPQRRMPD